ncbi:ANTH-domain-containing protein [Aulographum hederae CBS 113979]|uniref:ANTH-domain-containing protein n=1 Tax=Aulographum hederae CBS 113979 TaxID=1176131 RepID=A0A6G1HB74_9PEZI|nr:ANTH-domain-containing protein [Aulographum hederae CBS 113979]
MASSFEKSVKGGTKIKLAAPKSKYVEHILIATHAGDHGVAEVFRALQNRLRDSTWTIVFKSLIIVHFMIREGEPDVTLAYLSHGPQHKLAINNFTEVQTQGKNIRAYAEYLLVRATSFGSTKVDYVRQGEGRLKRLTVDKGLLREVESVEDQIRALVKCDFMTLEPENEITLTAFRLLVMDLLMLFHVMNEGVIGILEQFFEMSKPDAERSIKIYKWFTKLTDKVVRYLSNARVYEVQTRLEIPKIKHAPTTLTNSLEDYIKDTDFDSNRRQYMAQKEAKKNGQSKPFGDKSSESEGKMKFPSPKASTATPANQQPKAPAPDLIDFFERIETAGQDQTQANITNNNSWNPFAQQPAPPVQLPTGFQSQNNGFQQPSNLGFQQPQQHMPPQQTNPFGQPQQQQNFNGSGFGGFPPQSQNMFAQQPTGPAMDQNGQASFSGLNQQQLNQQMDQQMTNPFRMSMMPNATGNTFNQPANRQSTNPFAQSLGSNNQQPSPFAPQQQPSPFQPQQQQQQQQPPPFQPQQQQQQPPSFPPQPQNQQTLPPLQVNPTGSNPFARNTTPQQNNSPASASGGFLAPNATGSTNPFRQSAFVNQQTGQGWQNMQQSTMGGLEHMPTVPVFPRPGQQPQQQQQQ